MEGIIKLHFKYTEEEYISATRLYMMRSSDFLFRLTFSSILLMAGILLILLLNLDTQITFLFVFVGVVWLLLLSLIFFVVPRQRFHSDPKFLDEYFLQFSEDGIHFKTAQIDSLIQWSLYSKVLEDDRFYLMVYGKNMISIIPKRAFARAADEEAFNRLLRRKIPAYSDSKRLKGRAPDQLERPYVPPAEPPDWR